MASKSGAEKSQEAADAVGGRKIPQCKPCSTNNKLTAAQVYCHDCKEYYCSECSNYHKAFAFMSGHNIVDWKLKDPEENTVNMFGFDKCTEHGNLVTIYCEDHDVFCCSTCGFSGHKLCENAKGIHEFSVEVNIVRDTLTACNEKASKFLHSIKEIGKKEEKEIREKAEAIKSEFIQKIDRDTLLALKDIQAFADALKSSKKEDITKVSHIQVDLNLMRNSLNSASVKNLHDKCFILCKYIKLRTIEYGGFLNEQSYDTIPIGVHVECHHAIDTFVNVEETLIKLLDDNGFIHESCSETLECNLVTTKTFCNSPMGYVKDTNDNQRKQILHLTSMARLAFKNEGSYISGLDFFPDGRIIVVDNSKRKCFLLNGDMHIIGKKFHFYTYPIDVCVYKENRAAVTSDTHLYLLQVKQHNCITLYRKVPTYTPFHSINKLNCSMLLSCKFNKTNSPFTVVDFEGNETNFTDTGLSDTKYNKIEELGSTYITPLGILVLPDTCNSKVYLFNILSGEIKHVEDECIQERTRACVAPDNTVFVTSTGNNTIVRISPEGQVLQALMLSFEPMNVNCIMDEHLVVSSYDRTLYRLAYHKGKRTFAICKHPLS